METFCSVLTKGNCGDAVEEVIVSGFSNSLHITHLSRWLRGAILSRRRRCIGGRGRYTIGSSWSGGVGLWGGLMTMWGCTMVWTGGTDGHEGEHNGNNLPEREERCEQPWGLNIHRVCKHQSTTTVTATTFGTLLPDNG